MEDKKYNDIMTGIHKLDTGQAVQQAKMEHISETLAKSVENYEKLEVRVDVHDKIVGAISIAVIILGTLIKYRVI